MGGAVKRQNAERPNGKTKWQNGPNNAERVSLDAGYNGEVRNVVTSCFARQTGSDNILGFTIVIVIPRNPLQQYWACSAISFCHLVVLRSAVLPFYSTGVAEPVHT